MARTSAPARSDRRTGPARGGRARTRPGISAGAEADEFANLGGRAEIDLLLQRWASLRVVVVGDVILDRFLHGRVERVCREAPVPLVAAADRIDVPGGAANLAANAAGLGASVRLLSVVGDDEDADRLSELLPQFDVAADLIRVPGRGTLVAQRIEAAGQLLLRVDTGTRADPPGPARRALLRAVDAAVAGADVLLISDYGVGTLGDRVVAELARRRGRLPAIVATDAKQPARLRSLEPTVAKPNWAEASTVLPEAASVPPHRRAEHVVANRERLVRSFGARLLAVTLDADGSVVLERGRRPRYTRTTPQPDDHATGAGDTYLAAFALSLAAGAGAGRSAAVAQTAASLVVARPDTACCRASDLHKALAPPGKVARSAAELDQYVRAQRRRGARIVFTNGCFDLLHRGHVGFLERARALGDVLVVAVNDDQGVRALKGHDRPVCTLNDRIAVLAALESVDRIVGFPGNSPTGLLRTIRPDVFAKGADYRRETLPEAGLLGELGVELVFVPIDRGRSTTALIARVRGGSDARSRGTSASRVRVPPRAEAPGAVA